MELIKKLTLTFLIILFVISIFKDLTVGTIVTKDITSTETEDQPVENEATPEQEPTVEENSDNDNLEFERYQVVRQTTQPGDTVISIVESLNQNADSVHIHQVIDDFEFLNPGVESHKIKPNISYLFPVYKE